MLVTSAVVPALRINNRRRNLAFFEEDLGMKTIVEEMQFVHLGDHGSKAMKLFLVESPGIYSRAVIGPKKLEKIVVKVRDPKEIEALLAAGSQYTQLYRGENGYAFRAVSPEGDPFLLHSESDIHHLQEIETPASFETLEDFKGLTNFEIEAIYLNSSQPEEAAAYYHQFLAADYPIYFVEAQGQDLKANAEAVWDIESLHFAVPQDYDLPALKETLGKPAFIDRKERFMQTVDLSNIELWFEK